MNTLSLDDVLHMMETVAALLPFPARVERHSEGKVGPRGPRIQFSPPGQPEDFAVITPEMFSPHPKNDPYWWFESWSSGYCRNAWSDLGPDAHPADVAAWITEQAYAKGIPAAMAPGPELISEDLLDEQQILAQRRKDKLGYEMATAARALRVAFGYGPHAVRDEEHLRNAADIFRIDARWTPSHVAFTRSPDGGPVPAQARVFTHETECLLTVEFYRPRAGSAVPHKRTRQYKTGRGAARAILAHLATL